MEATTFNDQRMYPIVVLYDMHSDFFHKVLEEISDDDAHNRLGTKANHVAWLTGSLVEQRFDLARMLGLDLRQTAHELFNNNQGIKDAFRYPSLSNFKTDWDRITPLLRGLLQEIHAQKLDESFEMMPGMQMTYFDMVTFCTYREANCIGQIALYRRLMGYEAMKYM